MEMKYSLIGRIQNQQFSELKEEMTSLVAKKIANRIQAAKEDAIKKINEGRGSVDESIEKDFPFEYYYDVARRKEPFDITTDKGKLDYHKHMVKQLAGKQYPKTHIDSKHAAAVKHYEKKLNIKKINESNIVENKDIRAFYQSKSPNFLKKIINTAANTYKLHASWDAPNTDDKDELISHIHDMSNDHQLSPGSDGHLVKRP